MGKLRSIIAFLLLFVSTTALFVGSADAAHEEGRGHRSSDSTTQLENDRFNQQAHSVSIHLHEDPFQDQEQDCSGSPQCAHTCHFGHCSFTPVGAMSFSIKGTTSSYVALYVFSYRNISLADPIRPPRRSRLT